MQQFEFITGVDEGASGVGQYGPWQAYNIKTAGGNRYGTFKDEHAAVARLAQQNGLQVSLTYDTETVSKLKDDGTPVTYHNHKLKSIELVGGNSAGAQALVQQPQVTQQTGYANPNPTVNPTPQGGSQDAYRRSKEELRRSDSLSLAVKLVEAGVSAENLASVEPVRALVARFLETGSWDFQPQTAGQPFTPSMDTAPEPVAFDPQTGAPIY